MTCYTLKCRASRRFASVELSHYSQACPKRYVFKFFLKSEIEQEFLTVIGKLFHTRGPATENALEAMFDPAKGMARTS